MAQQISDEQWRELLETRATRPAAVAEAYASRKRPEGLLSERGTIFLVAADHPARGCPGVRRRRDGDGRPAWRCSSG